MSEQTTNGLSRPGYDVDLPDVPVKQGALFDPTARQISAWASFDVTTQEGYVRLATMKHGEKRPLETVINTVIQVQNVYIQAVEKVDEKSGECVVFPFIVLETPDGTCYNCGSRGVYGCIVDALRFRPETPWSPPMSFKVIQVGLKNGHRTFKLLPVFEAQSAPAKKGGGRG